MNQTVQDISLKGLVAQSSRLLEQQSGSPKNLFLQDIRNKALAAFEAMDFPTFKHEEWKYTNLKPVLSKEFKLGEPNSGSVSVAGLYPENTPCNLLVFVNGHYMPSLSKIVSDPKELIVCSLAEALEKHTETVTQHFGAYADASNDIFTAMNTVRAEDGLFVFVPEGKSPAEPVVVLHLNDTENGNVLAQPRKLLVLAENSRLVLFENSDTKGEGHCLQNAVTEIVLGRYANMKHIKLQNENPNAHQIERTQAEQAADSVYSNHTFTFSGGIIRNNLGIRLSGEHAEGNMYGLFDIGGDTLADNHTVMDHAMPNCNSNELYKGILAGKSRGVFNGKIFVRKDAQKTNAFQANHNILLSDDAIINTKPQLEIWADDVKCSHGATTGALDEEPMFYLRARGISENDARRMLLAAYSAEVIDKIGEGEFKEFIQKAAGLAPAEI